MHLEKWFHFWFYATLAVGSICLALPTTFFVPWMPVLLTVTLVLLFLAWRHEGSWVLSDTAANYVGVFIALGAAGWILFQVPRSEDDLIAGGVPWPAGLLPHLSPLLMMLLMVKVYRPKRLPDFWVIQTIGLMTVTLAAVLADAPVFGIFLIAYLFCLVWCLALYHPVREQRLLNARAEAAQVPLFAEAPVATPAAAGPAAAGPGAETRTRLTPVATARWPAAWRLGGAFRVARWTLLALVIGQAIFLAAPRQAPSYWDAKQLSMSGVVQARRGGVEPGIDMNRTGRVELSEAPAFNVAVVDAAGAPVTLPDDQHWQVEVYEYYASGRWYPLNHAQARLRVINVAPMQTLPNVTRADAVPAGDIAFRFEVKPAQTGGLVLAEPAALGRLGLAPTLDGRPHDLGFFAHVDGCDTVVSQFGQVTGRRRVYGYEQQVTPPAGDRFPAAVTNRAYQLLIGTQGAPTALQSFARDLLKRVAGLSAQDRELDEDQRVPPARHAKVARALCNHLAQSGEYRYTLELRRHDARMDPAVDFLLNVKEGHCERYAGALALLLRTLGIPCRVAGGYLGAETEEPGQYVVRQNQAHSWVQALVPRDGAAPKIGRPAAALPALPAEARDAAAWQWLVLDPTPTVEAPRDPWTGWLQWFQDNFDSRQFWRQMIMEYSPDQQANTVNALWRQVASPRGLWAGLALAAAAVLFFGGRRSWRWLWTAWRTALPGGVVPEAALYRRLVRLMAPLGVVPSSGATPREFADSATAALRLRALDGPLAATPLDVVAAYYATRFGAQPLSPLDQTDLENRIDALSARLAN